MEISLKRFCENDFESVSEIMVRAFNKEAQVQLEKFTDVTPGA